MPSVNTRRPRVSARPPAVKTQLKVYDTIPYPNDWPSWRDNLAIGKLPRADGYNGRYTQPELDKILQHLGFTSDGRGCWDHQDGSAVSTSAGRIATSRFQKWGFGDFPYRVAQHGPQWTTDTLAWTKWLQNGGPAPFPAFVP